MKLVRYEKDWKGRWGILEGDTVHQLVGDPYGECRAGEPVGALGDLKLLAPATPSIIWSLGANYPSRCHERNFEDPTAPAISVVAGSSICGTDQEIRIPEFETRVEYGVELAIVLKRDCHDVEESEVDDYILGYTGLNNVWVKDPAHIPYRKPLRVYDNCCPTGPLVNTEMDGDNVRLRLWVDGEPRQDDSTSTVFFPYRHVVSWLSKRVAIKQGDVIMTGSPGGIEGHVLHFGEVVEMEVEGVGRIRNRVTRVDNAAVSYVVSLEKWLEMQQTGAVAGPSSFS